MQPFRSLRVWNDAHRLTLEVYRATAAFPAEERFGLSSQLRRSASSIAANLAEGAGRQSRPDFDRFVVIALGSCEETGYHLLLARDLGYVTSEHSASLNVLVGQVGRQLQALHRRLRAPDRSLQNQKPVTKHPSSANNV